MIKISFLFSLLLLFACCDSKSKHKVNKSLKKKSIENIKEEKSFTAWKGPTEEEKNAMRLELIQDSLHHIQLIRLGKQIVLRNIHKKHFAYSSDSLSVQTGHLMSNSIKHIWINTCYGGMSITTVFLYKDLLLIKLFSQENNAFTVIGSTFKDVNGDSLKDFLYHTYSACGCCMRDVYEVYLQNSLGNFSKGITLMNPAFYPNEKIIRGLDYGHLAPFYKYKWNGTTIDTIEYIHREIIEKSDNIEYIRKKTDSIDEKGIILKRCPKEYINLWDDMESNNK